MRTHTQFFRNPNLTLIIPVHIHDAHTIPLPTMLAFYGNPQDVPRVHIFGFLQPKLTGVSTTSVGSLYSFLP